MEPRTEEAGGGLSERERRFLARLAQKYEGGEDAGRARSYAIATATAAALFAVARWVPWWPAALVLAGGAGLFLYAKYKKFARFKTRLLVQLWRERGESAPGGREDG